MRINRFKKYLCSHDGFAFAVKWDTEIKLSTFYMETNNYSKLLIDITTWFVSRNLPHQPIDIKTGTKKKVSIKLSPMEWKTGFEKMNKACWYVENVNNFGRFTR